MTEWLSTTGYLIPLLPLLGAVVNGSVGRALQQRFGAGPVVFVAVSASALSFLGAVLAFQAVSTGPPDGTVCRLYPWIEAGRLRVDLAFAFDRLSAVMIFIITGVGALIHIYSIGYMKGDPGTYRYFAYLNLFVFSMLVLVLAENVLLLFLGWEGVGLCSYLLIGFWYGTHENTVAANKAFIVNRVGDFGFLMGFFLLFWSLSSALPPDPSGGGASLASFSLLKAESVRLLGQDVLGVSLITVIALLLFLGATGKSAQIPLYVWLPDAMAGPTPVSALIHAATMVTAGIYLIARMHFLFALSDAALSVIAVTGTATAFLAATLGCVQNDIKKILAYSTISQLGYMFLGLGVGAQSASLFHLMTHAFFKACLFLGAGSVILALHHEQDIRRMGGLLKRMPLTGATFIIASVAICGIPPFSGFFSKDAILWAAWSAGPEHPVPGSALWLVGLVTAGLTAFYMTRLVVRVFFGRPAEGQGSDPDGHGDGDVKESPRVVTVPLVVLAALSAAAGLLGVPAALGGSDRFGHFLGPIIGAVTEHGHDPMETLLMAVSVLTAFSGIGFGLLLYRFRPELPARFAERLSRLHRLLVRKYYVDETYGALFVGGLRGATGLAAAFDRTVVDGAVRAAACALRLKAIVIGWFDRRVVDGAVDGLSRLTNRAGEMARGLQTGRVQVYVLILFAVVIAVAAAGIFFQGG